MDSLSATPLQWHKLLKSVSYRQCRNIKLRYRTFARFLERKHKIVFVSLSLYSGRKTDDCEK